MLENNFAGLPTDWQVLLVINQTNTDNYLE